MTLKRVDCALRCRSKVYGLLFIQASISFLTVSLCSRARAILSLARLKTMSEGIFNDMKRTQKTKTGHEIPIPKRGDVLGLFKKAATHREKVNKKSDALRSPKK